MWTICRRHTWQCRRDRSATWPVSAALPGTWPASSSSSQSSVLHHLFLLSFHHPHVSCWQSLIAHFYVDHPESSLFIPGLKLFIPNIDWAGLRTVSSDFMFSCFINFCTVLFRVVYSKTCHAQLLSCDRPIYSVSCISGQLIWRTDVINDISTAVSFSIIDPHHTVDVATPTIITIGLHRESKTCHQTLSIASPNINRF